MSHQHSKASLAPSGLRPVGKVLFGMSIFFSVYSTGSNATDFTLTSGDRASGNFNILNNGSDANGPGILDVNGSLVINYGYNNQSWNLAVNGSGQSRPYVFQQFNVDTTGSYNFGIRTSAFVDPFMLVYRGSFNPSSPNANIIAGNDDGSVASNGCGPGGGNGTLCPQIQGAALTAGTQYYMVVTTWGTGSPLTYPFTFYCTGPGVCTFISPGPDEANTRIAITTNRGSLNSLLSQRATAISFMMDYDCATFDGKGYCVSFRARYTGMDSQNEGAGVFTAAYRVSEKVRIGGFVDYRASEKDSAGVKQGDTMPTFGAFAAYSQSGDATGFQAKASAAYNSGKVTVTRSNSLANTEAGSGKTGLNSYAIGAELAWGFAVSPTMLATPYAGVRYSDATRNGYAERTVAGTVDFPITYNAYYQRLTTATAGVRLSGKFSDKVGYQASLGGEYDLAHKSNAYSGTSTIPDLETFAIANTGSSNRSRVVASAGLYYQMDKTQRLTATVGVRGQAYSSQPSVTTLVGYQVAF